MSIIAMLIAAAIVFVWYLISLLFKFSVFKDNHKINNKVYSQTVIVVIFTFLLAVGLIVYYNLLEGREDEFLFSSGIIFSLFITVLGVIISLIYKLVVKIWNAQYKKKYGEAGELYSPKTPISVLFDMAIIVVGLIAYKLDVMGLVGICVSLLCGEHLGLNSMTSKIEKEDRLFYKMKQVPIFTYVSFAVMVAAAFLDIKLSWIIGAVVGIFVGVILIVIVECIRKNKGKHSDLQDYQEYMSNTYESEKTSDLGNNKE